MSEEQNGHYIPWMKCCRLRNYLPMACRHVLAMYAGAVAVPIIVAQAMHLSAEQLIHLINADLFTCGIATLIQTLGFWKVGARIPMIQGVTFASVTPMIVIGTQGGMTAIYGP